MKKNNENNLPNLEELRKKAEEITSRSRANVQQLTREEIQRLVHDLEVHQVELELQNEELRRAQQELAESRDRYYDLYDLAPIGYVTLNRNGIIQEANLASALMFGVERTNLIKSRFSRYLHPGYHSVFYMCLKSTVENSQRQICELQLAPQKGAPLLVQLDCIPVENNIGSVDYIRAAMTNITERKESNFKLQESERAYRSLAEHLPGIVYRLHLREKNRMQFFNKAFVSLTGYSELELKQGNICFIDPLILPEDRPAVLDTVRHAIAEMRPFSIEYRLQHKDGSIRYVVEQGNPIRGADEKTVYIDGIINDITNFKQLETKIQESEEKFRNFVAHSSDGISIVDEEGKIIEWNAAMEELTGLEQQQAIGKLLWDVQPQFLPATEKTETNCQEQKTKTQKFNHNLQLEPPGKFAESTILRVDGSKRIIESHSFPIATKNKLLFGVIIRDVTQRKKEEEHTRFQAAILQNVRDGVIVTDLEGKITYWNEGAGKIFGYTAEEMTGKSVTTLMPTENGKDVGLNLPIIREGKDFTGEWEGRRKDGTLLWTDLKTTFMRDAKGQAYGLLGVAKDITAHKHAEERLREQAQILDQIHDAVVSTDLEGYITSWNMGAERLFGYTAAECIGKHIAMLYREEQRDFLANEVIAPLKEKGTHAVEVRKRDKTGRLFYAHLSLALMKDELGQPRGMIGYSMDITERMEAQEEQKNYANRITTILESINDAFFSLDKNWRYTYLNAQAENVVCKKREELLNKVIWDVFPETLGTPFEHEFKTAMVTKAASTFSAYYEPFKAWYEVHVYPSADGLSIYYQDVTERIEKEKALKRANRALRTVSAFNRALLSIKDEKELCRYACHALVEMGGYRLAWVAYKQNDANKSIRPVAQTGYEYGYLESIKLSWGDNEYGQGPAGTAIRLNKATVSRNLQTDPQFLPWREKAIKRGYNSSIGIPISNEVETLGVLSVYSRETDAFDEEEIRLLVELSDQLAFGITALRIKAETKKTEKALLESQQKFKTQYKGIPVPTYTWQKIEKEFILVDCNQAAVEFTKGSIKKLLGSTVDEMFPASLQVTRDFERCMRENTTIRREISYKSRFTDLEGLFNNTILFVPPAQIVVHVEDITRKRRTEIELRIREEQQRAIAQFGQSALQVKEPKKLFDQAVRIIATTMNMEYCKVLELLPDGNALLLRSGVGWKKGHVGHTTVGAEKSSQAGLSLDSKAPIVVPDFNLEKRFSASPLLREHKVRSGVSVLIHGEDRPFGVLGVHSKKPRRFSEDDINFLQAVSSILATAIKRISAEEAVQRSEDKFRTLFETSQDAIFIMKDGRTFDCNPSALEMFRCSKNQIIDTPPHKFSPLQQPDGVDSAKAAQRKMSAALKGKRQLFEWEHVRADGAHFTAEVSLNRLTVGNKQFLQTIVRDITQRKKWEQTLKESESRYRGLMESAPDAVIVTNEDGRILLINTQAERLFGYSPPEIIGEMIEKLIAKEMRAIHKKHRLQYLNGPQTRAIGINMSLLGLSKEKKVFPIEISLSSLQTENGMMLTSIIHDVTERREAEKRLEYSHEQLRKLSVHLQSAKEEESKRIARKIHDELGQGLIGLKMNLSWLLDRLPEDERILREKTNFMLNLIDDSITTVEKISSELRPRILDILGLQEAMEWYGKEFQETSGIRCEITFRPKDFDVKGEISTEAYRIFQEAMVNIHRHAGARKVQISLSRRSGNLLLTIKDDGVGITKEQITGLNSFGIMGMQERTRTVGGKIKILGAPGKGTTIKATIPLKFEKEKVND